MKKIAIKDGGQYWVKTIDDNGRVIVEQFVKTLDKLGDVEIVDKKLFKKQNLKTIIFTKSQGTLTVK